MNKKVKKKIMLFTIIIIIIITIIILIIINKIQSKKKEDKSYENLNNFEKKIICRKGRNRCYGKDKIWKENNKKEYMKLITELIKNKKSPFLSGGTLLGIIREGDVLKNDDDMNFSIFDYEDDEIFKNILHKLDYKNIITHKYKKYKQYTIKKGSINNNDDIEIDIPIWKKNKNNYYFCSKFFLGELYKFELFKIKKVKLWSGDIYIPENPDKYLKQAYGDWKNPSPKFNYPFDSPSYVKPKKIKSILYFFINFFKNFYLEL